MLDHAKSIPDALRCGVKVYSNEDVAERYKGVFGLKELKGYKIKDFKVFVVPMSHDVPCVGFVIEHPEMGKLLFATDTMMVKYRFKGLNHVMLEANYSDALLDGNVDGGFVHGAMRSRLMTTHMSLENAVDMLTSNDLSGVNEVVLIHLSDSNADAAQFSGRVASATGKPVYVARKGLELDLNMEVY